jgi:uncharacterized damage-inducible protein DinB
VKLNDILIATIDREAPITKRVLDGVPEGRDEWKPHEKSMPLGRLASLVAMMPSWLTMMIEKEEFDIAPATPQPSQFNMALKTRAELVKAMEEGFAGAKRALQSTTEEHLLKSWRLKARGNVVLEMSRHDMMRDSLMHLAHHRGQLTVYLRLNNVPVPATYGPSADDQRF